MRGEQPGMPSRMGSPSCPSRWRASGGQGAVGAHTRVASSWGNSLCAPWGGVTPPAQRRGPGRSPASLLSAALAPCCPFQAAAPGGCRHSWGCLGRWVPRQGPADLAQLSHQLGIHVRDRRALSSERGKSTHMATFVHGDGCVTLCRAPPTTHPFCISRSTDKSGHRSATLQPEIGKTKPSQSQSSETRAGFGDNGSLQDHRPHGSFRNVQDRGPASLQAGQDGKMFAASQVQGEEQE